MTATCTVCELHAESTFKIEGMDCREEVTLLERRFSHLAGLEDFSADVMGQRLHVKYDAARLSTATIADAVADTGMRRGSARRAARRLAAGRADAARPGVDVRRRPGARLDPRMVRRRAGVTGWIFGVSIAAGILAVGRRAWQSVRARVLDINVLMMIAVAGAIILRSTPKPPPSSSCSPLRRRSKCGRSNGRATRSAR